MISELAIADIEQMKNDGLEPTIKDIIRLNALGLQIEFSDDDTTAYILPRVAYLGKLTLREPTIAHHNWIDRVKAYINLDDYSSYLAVYCFCLSHNFDNLPDATDKDLITKSINEFCDKLAPYTINQIRDALRYALYGNDVWSMEYPDSKNNTDTDDFISNPDCAVGCGLLV